MSDGEFPNGEARVTVRDRLCVQAATQQVACLTKKAEKVLRGVALQAREQLTHVPSTSQEAVSVHVAHVLDSAGQVAMHVPYHLGVALQMGSKQGADAGRELLAV